MPDDAVEKIMCCWRERGSDRYAGIMGLDFDTEGKPLGGYFPEDLKETYFLDMYIKNIHKADTKEVMRTELMKKVAPQVGFEGEKNFNPVYMLLQVCDDYPLIVLNENLARDATETQHAAAPPACSRALRLQLPDCRRQELAASGAPQGACPGGMAGGIRIEPFHPSQS